MINRSQKLSLKRSKLLVWVKLPHGSQAMSQCMVGYEAGTFGWNACTKSSTAAVLSSLLLRQIVCISPGFTSKGGNLPVEVDVGEPVAIYAEGKEHCMALGITTMSTAEIKSVNKGMAVEITHFLLDGLYNEPGN